jgi:hypothetical protein
VRAVALVDSAQDVVAASQIKRHPCVAVLVERRAGQLLFAVFNGHGAARGLTVLAGDGDGKNRLRAPALVVRLRSQCGLCGLARQRQRRQSQRHCESQHESETRVFAGSPLLWVAST